MNFYKVIAKIGHRGLGKYGDMGLYLAAESFVDASNQAKGFPGVRHHQADAIDSVKLISEKEFVVGILKTAYVSLSYHAKNQQIQTLDKIETSIADVDHFDTIEGKMLKNFCNRYAATDDIELKKKVDEEFVAWANKQLEQEYSDNENFSR